jgi:hypothetical protein
MLYVGVSFQVNRSLEMTSDIGQNRLYEFCYLLYYEDSTCGFFFGKDPFPTRM